MNSVLRPLNSCRQDRGARAVFASRTSVVIPRVHALQLLYNKNKTALNLERSRVVALRAVSEVVESALPATPVPETPSEPAVTPVDRIKIARNGNVKTLAGKVAHATRIGDPPTAVCVGPNCTNLGVKTVAIARQYLANENIDLSFQPFSEQLGLAADGKPLTGLALKVFKHQPPAAASPAAGAAEALEMHIPSKGKYWLAAAALAARVREQQPVFLTAIGSGAVYKAALTIEKARKYLKDDKKDLRVVPSFIQVQKKDQTVAALRFDLVVVDA